MSSTPTFDPKGFIITTRRKAMTDRPKTIAPAPKRRLSETMREEFARRAGAERSVAQVAESFNRKTGLRRVRAGEVMPLYWAYGSNLSHEQMRWRCPNARPFAPLALDNGRLIFRGVADVMKEHGSKVVGGLYKITPGCERSLDRYEGVAGGFYKKRYIDVTVQGKVHRAFFYVMNTDEGVMPPSEPYLDTIAQGFNDFNLPLAYLEDAVRHSWDEKLVNRRLLERHIRKGRPALATPDFLYRDPPEPWDEEASDVPVTRSRLEQLNDEDNPPSLAWQKGYANGKD